MRVNERILVVGPAWVGDMVMAQSLFAELKTRHPDSVVDVLAPAWSAGIVERMPQVNELVESPFTHGRLNFVKRYRMARTLAVQGYTRAIVLPNSWKSALVPALAQIPTRTGYLGEQRWGLVNDVRRLDTSELPMMVQRFVALGRANDAPPPLPDSISLPRLKVEEGPARETARRLGVHSREGQLLVLCPGSEFGPAKQWPMERYADIARHYLDMSWRVAIIGSGNDKAVGDRICGLAGDMVNNLAGKTTLVEAAEILSLAGLVVTNDSGLMHIASAVGAPVVAVYGSTDPTFTPPLGEMSTIVRLGLECSPCFKRECPLGHLDCLNKIDVEQVIRAAGHLLRGSD